MSKSEILFKAESALLLLLHNIIFAMPKDNTFTPSCSFIDHDIHSSLKQKRKLSLFIQNLIFEYTKKVAQLQYVFVSDEYLLQLNQEYLTHDTLTDIITFDLSEKKSSKLKAEIYISAERVKENAKLFNITYPNELHRVIFHGALHLCGFKDKNKQQQILMREAEENCLKKYFNE